MKNPRKPLAGCFLFLFILFSLSVVHAADRFFPAGARSFALGNIRSLGEDRLNPAELSQTDERRIGLSVFNRFAMSELNTAEVYYHYPNRLLDAGFRFETFGYQDYRVSRLQGSFAKKIREGLSVGICLNYLKTRTRWEDGAQHGFSSGLGLYYRASERLDLALSGDNLLCTPGAAVWRWQAGGRYRISPLVAFFSEAGYDRETRFRLSGGIEYRIDEQLRIRSGYDTDSGQPAFGAGYAWKDCQVDVGFSLHTTLGMSSMIGVSYLF
jgi:hypothetical protein